MTGEEIKAKREQLNLTRREMAELLGLTPAAILWYERRQVVRPSTSKVLQMFFEKQSQQKSA